jgi:hypothetical protein
MGDGTGLCIYAKRLGAGRFAYLWRDGRTGALRLAISELQPFLESWAILSRVPLSPAPFVMESLRKNLDPSMRR